jgi:RHS repeat-associated protein
MSIRSKVVLAVVVLGIGLIAGNRLQAAQNPDIGPASMALSSSTVTPLPDGTVLVLGGMNGDGHVQATAMVRNPATASASSLPTSLIYARAGHTATVLPDGTVLVLGGIGPDGKVVSTSEIFDPVTKSFHAISSGAPTPRAFHTATLLTDGRLLIAGGVSQNGQILQSGELWDFRQKRQSVVIPWPTARRNHSATLLANGDVLLQGGKDGSDKSMDGADVFDRSSQIITRLSDTQNVLQGSSAAEVRASSPEDGATDVPIDVLISMRFSCPVRMVSINERTVSLKGPDGLVEAKIVAAEGGMLGFITPSASLISGTVYQVTLSGAVDGRDATVPFAQFTFTTAGVAPGDPNHWQPTADGRAHLPPSPYEKLALPQAPPGVTALVGRVLKLDGNPLPNMTLKIGKRTALTDKNGIFLLLNIDSGHQDLVMDGSTAKDGKNVYGLYEASLEVVSSQTNILPYTIWMTALDMAHEVTIPSPTVTETVVKTPLIPGLELHIPADTVITDYEGKPVTKLTITQIPLDRPPFPLPNTQMLAYVTIQPGLSYIHVLNSGSQKRGARLFYPNLFSAPNGTILNLWDYDADGPGWFVYGQARVEPPGAQAIPFPGVEIYEFTGAGVANLAIAALQAALACDPKSPGHPACPKGGEPVDLSTGLFIHNKTDLIVSDVIPLTLTRTYRPNDSVSRAFGIGATHPYDIFIDSDYISFGFVDLVLPDGSRIHYDCNQPPSNGCPGGTYSHTTSPTDFYGSTLQSPGQGSSNWRITMKNGTVLAMFGPSELPIRLVSITDRYGNTVTINRDSTSGNGARVTSIVSPHGRSITFSYDNYNHVSKAVNNGGQTVNYAYDGYGRLVAVADANAAACVVSNPSTWMTINPGTGMTVCPTTSYTYDGGHRMLTVTDPKGILYLTNQYDSGGRVTKQTLADGSTYTFTWTIANTSQTRIYSSGGGNGTGIIPGYLLRGCVGCYAGYMPLVSKVDVTDQRGFVRRVTFGLTGYVSSDIYALGRPEEQDFFFQDFADNLLQKVTDPMGNVTALNYDNNGNLISSTWLSGTSSSATTTYTYDTGGFNQLLSVTDPLHNTWSFSYDNNGNMTAASDPLQDKYSFTYNAAGQVLTASDALPSPNTNTSSYSYNYFGDLVAFNDPLGNTTNFTTDSVGRPLAVTDALNETTAYQYDSLNQVIKGTDPRGSPNGVTSFTYDGNGNLLTVQDPSQQTTSLMTSYVYDNMDRVITRTDPLQRQEWYQYDIGGNLIQFTDRRGKITTLNYDALNRPTFVGFGTVPGNPNSYESTINYSYDGYDRLLAAADSAAGANLCPTVLANASICDTYTDVSLTPSSTETTPNGTLTYIFDQAGHRKSMSVAGQPLTTYTYDSADRLTQISQATTPTATITNFNYDADSRRTSFTLPNGVSTAYCYDKDSRLTSLLYNTSSNTCLGGQANLGSLSYGYDLVGRRTQVWSVFARTGLPQPVASATYDSANELLQWNGQLFSYDLNGNMISDGGNTYTWDARNQLLQFNAVGFKYDAAGRRTKNAVGNTQLYDGADSVQELSGTTVLSNRITGGVDEFFNRTESGNSYTPLSDALGNTIGLVNSSGNITTQYTYDPFGNTTVTTLSGSASNNSFEYTGRENDSTGLYYYRARYYNPAIGRFISEDPLGFDGDDVNFYSYAGDDSIDFADPSGMFRPGGKHKPKPPKPPTVGRQCCFAQLKYRHVNYAFNRNHAFWWVQDRNGHQYIVDGGPSGAAGSGYLNHWVTPGTVGHYPEDNPNATTAFDTGLSPDVCDAVDRLLAAANAWQDNTIVYFKDGPNSNTFAREVGAAGGFNPPQPPKTAGWNAPHSAVPFPW